MKGGASCPSDPCSVKKSTRLKYDDQWKSHDEKAASERRKALSMVSDPLLCMVHPLTGKVVVDLGTGTGALAFRALELSPPARMIGIDFSAPGLCVAKNISKHDRFKDLDVEMMRADLERIPLANRCAEVIVSQATINLLPDKSTAFREIARIAKPGAKIAISDAFRTSRPTQDESWEQCIAGAITVAEFSAFALSAGLIITGQVDLTQHVRQLVVGKKWDWPEFIEHNMDYRAILMARS